MLFIFKTLLMQDHKDISTIESTVVSSVSWWQNQEDGLAERIRNPIWLHAFSYLFHMLK